MHNSEVKELSFEEKVKLGKIRPYTYTSDMMIIEDIDNGYDVSQIAAMYDRDIDDLQKHIAQITQDGTADKIRKIKTAHKKYYDPEIDKGYENLYLAIFQQAAKDDFAHAKEIIYKDLKDKGETELNIQETIKSQEHKLQKDINTALLEEAKNYPATTTAKSIRKLYKISRQVQ
jgi:hypothetical protein